MKITVIVPSYRRPADLHRCLEAIRLQNRPPDEVLVIARDGDESTAEVVVKIANVLSTLRLVPVFEPGLIAALNRGLDAADGDILAFTDDDAEPNYDWLQRMEAGFSDPSIGALGGRDWLQLPDEPWLFQPKPASRIGLLTWYGTQFGGHHCPTPGHTRKVMFLKGVNMAFRRGVLGNYRIDTNLRGSGAQVGTELDLCLRLPQAGYSLLFDDRILVKHYSSPRVTSDERNQLDGTVFSDLCFNNHYLAAKHLGFFRAIAYLCNERLLGSHSIPGLLACLKWHLKGDSLVWRRSSVMAASAFAGFRAGRQARAATRQNPICLDKNYSSSESNA